MDKFIPREKLSKKARRELDKQSRVLWENSPVTRVVESKKHKKERNSKIIFENF